MLLRRTAVLVIILCALLPAAAMAQATQDGLLAYQALNAGDFELAEFYATRALESGELRRPDHAAVLTYRGDALRRMGRFEEAVVDYTEAVETGLPPEFAARALNNRGIALFGMLRFEEAIRSYRGALELDPEFVEAMDNLGTTLMRIDELPEALEAFNAAIAIDPSNPRARNNRGRAFLELEFYEEALVEFTAAIELGAGGLATPVFLRGITYERLGDREAARADLARALELRPGEPTYQEKFREYGLIP
jgi:tetratricopeptide (TPR) repeat protein